MNIIRRFLLFCFLCLSLVSGARAEMQISVLTCSPGDEVYALYGHTALRCRDVSTGRDEVFNYGLFDFNTPNFTWRFVIGETDYMVGHVYYRDFVPEYELRGSGIVEQVLNLTEEEAEALYGLLLENVKPENRVYRYRYIDNNCTTKARDKILEALSGSGAVVYKGSPAKLTTYRDAMNIPIETSPWYVFGMNLLLGADVDEEPSREAMQFLPENFMNDLAGAYIVAPDGTERKLVSQTNILLKEKEKTAERNNFTPFNVSLLLLLGTFIIMLCELRKRKTYWGVDLVLMSLQGLPGLLLLFMALFSQHPAVDCNWLVLLLNPLALVLMPMMISRIRKHKSMKIAWVQVAFVALFLLTAMFGFQVYPTPIYFCAMALLARALFHLYKDKICELNIV